MNNIKTFLEAIFWLPENILNELNNPNWKDGGRVHNWKNYVDDSIKKIWPSLTKNEKIIIAFYAQQKAYNEDWD